MSGRRKFFKDFSRGWNAFELTMLIIGVVVPIVLGIVFNSSPLEIVTSILFITAMLLIAKAKIAGFLLALVAYALYVVVSFQKGLFGEVITIGLFSIPITIWTIFSWLRKCKECKDKDKKSTVEIVGIRPKELTLLVLSQIAMGVGYFFLLRALGTNFLIISTAALAVNVMGDYLCARRNVLGPFAYVLYDILTITLWLMVFINGGTGAIVILVMQIVTFVNDTYGIVNWIKLVKKNKSTEKESNPIEMPIHS
ncbi:MAG: nicotinamide riboside transporter PnuC [Firmicutes bacterium]|nr:nicotinamide riboside transporter PnuC [Bacillota bacterium]